MTTHAFELQPVRGIGTTVWQQFRLLAWSNRWVYLTAALIALLMLSGLAPVMPWPRTMAIGVLGLPAAVLWAMAVWQNESPSRRLAHWSLPVPRPINDLARVVAGAAFLVGAYAVLGLAGATWTYFDGTAADQQVGAAWISFFLAPLVIYFLVMPLVLWSEYRVTKWLLGVLFVIPPLMMLLTSIGWSGPEEAFVATMVRGELSLASAVFDPLLGDGAPHWLTAAAVWLIGGATLTAFAATWRPDDLRRLARADR